jgi:hypothetical protein
VNLILSKDRFMFWRSDAPPEDHSYFAVINAGDGWSIVEKRDYGNWRSFRIDGEFGFYEVGILLQILEPLADAEVPIMTLSAYHTDFVFVKTSNLQKAVEALRSAGHGVIEE